jgi:hypothetical protein
MIVTFSTIVWIELIHNNLASKTLPLYTEPVASHTN